MTTQIIHVSMFNRLCRCSLNRSDSKHWIQIEDTHSGPESGWWGAVFPGLTRAVSHHLTVDGAADTVVKLHIELGQNISCSVNTVEKGTDEDKPPGSKCRYNLWRRATWKTEQIHLQSKTLASEMSLTAAASTMFLMTNFLMALSLGTQRAQLVQRMGCTCPRPFLARPLFLLFLVCKTDINYSLTTRGWVLNLNTSLVQTNMSRALGVKTIKYQKLA